MGIESWSTTAASNNSASPNGAPEGMAPSGVNDTIRQNMASVRAFYENPQYINLGYTHTYASGTSFTIATTDYTSTYHAGRRIRAVGSSTGTIYGTITSSSYSSSTTVNVSWDSGSLQNETLTISISALTKTNDAIPYLYKKSADVASATTIDLDAIRGDLVDVTGTTTITTVTLAEGQERVVRFTGILTFTHGASLVLPGGANITTAAGDFAVLRGYASSVVRCVSYTRANGQALAATGSFTDVAVSGKFSNTAGATQTIATGAFTAVASNFLVDGEGAAADDLVTINGGVDGMEINMAIVSSSRIITFKHGTGNLLCIGSKDILVNNTNWQVRGKYRASDSKWLIWVVNNNGFGDLLDVKTASSSSELAFTTSITNAYSKYVFEFIDILPSTDGKGFQSLLSINAGSTYITSNYLGTIWASSNIDGLTSFTSSTTVINLCGNYNGDVNWGVDNSAGKGFSGSLTLFNPSSSTSNKRVSFDDIVYTNNTNVLVRGAGGIICNNTTSAINAIKFFFDSGNIASGEISMYGVK